jgi:hypothetical protein
LVTEARQLAEERMREISAMSLDDLLRFEDGPVDAEITGPSGRAYRVKIYAFWDMEPYESVLYVRVKVAGMGLRGYQRYFGVETRDPDYFEPEPEAELRVSPTWTEIVAWVIFALVLLALSAP